MQQFVRPGVPVGFRPSRWASVQVGFRPGGLPSVQVGFRPSRWASVRPGGLPSVQGDSRSAMGEVSMREDSAVTRSAEYVGSFPVDDRCLDEQMESLHRQLKALRTCKSRRAVSLKFSIKGVKMYNEDETVLLMAHALRRVSLSTARPADSQFAFVSHNPGSTDAQLYCHLFKARHARAAQFLNLLLCRCFQLFYLEKHPEEEASQDAAGPLPRRSYSLLNHGFPLSVSALVSFRRAPFRGLFPGAKSRSKTPEKKPEDREVVFTASPSLVRKQAIRSKGMRAGAYRSFTFTPLKKRHAHQRLGSAQEKDLSSSPAKKAHSPSLAETEEALAQAVWSWAGIAPDSCSALLEEDVLGSYLLCPHPKKPNCGSLLIRLPSGLGTYLIGNTRKGLFHLEVSKMFHLEVSPMFPLEKHKTEFLSLAALLDHYSRDHHSRDRDRDQDHPPASREELPCALSGARVNHCYEWEEEAAAAAAATAALLQLPGSRRRQQTAGRSGHPC
ncbi:SH2 domain-containing protein 5 [Merluccius polli]|uniref:SH2 domain-containing protein 5 n=1 Tax=Merluccius polli TaxID=89951 RepID=A0AA47P423_MERPO|nr:SH2 domain-containing protein 5 [Merluccius polli]